MRKLMRSLGFLVAVATAAALHHGPPRLSPRLRHGRATPIVLSAKKRTFEFCAVGESGEIESCELASKKVARSAPHATGQSLAECDGSGQLCHHRREPEEPAWAPT